MTGCGPATRELIARLTTPTRNRYYYGKLLDAYHMDLEQNFGNSKRWMLNRLSLGAGVLCGIGVKVTTDRQQVRVGSGVAIDNYGREIIVPQDSPPFDPLQPTDDCGHPAGDPIREGVVTLFLCYHECEAEPAPAMVDECGDSACENGLIRERYRLRVAPGTPAPPGTITDAQCKHICEEPPAGVTRRTVLCHTLGGPCGTPDESCVPIATLDIKGGAIVNVDACTFRTNVYSNAVLLDLILCLAERVDECCGPAAAMMTIAIQSGNNQSAAASQILPQPPITRVSMGGTAVLNESVTFDVIAGGGVIGASPGALAAQFTVVTNAAGDAALPVWRLGTVAGSSQQVKASISDGAFVIFDAKAADVPVAHPPVVRAIWPPNGVQFSSTSTAAEKKWLREFTESPHIKITFDRKMRQSDLQKPDTWLHMFAFIARGSNQSVGSTNVAFRLLLAYDGTVADPIPGVSGVTESYRIELPGEFGRLDTRYLIQMDPSGGGITESGGAGLMLDAKFDGTKLSLTQLDNLWPLTGSAATDAATLTALTNGSMTLPQSGDGTPGERFHSWLEVIP